MNHPTASSIKPWTVPVPDVIIIGLPTNNQPLHNMKNMSRTQKADRTEDNDTFLQQSRKNVCFMCGATQEVFIKQVIYIFLSIAEWFVQINLTRFPFSLSLIGSDSHIPCLHYTETPNLILAPVKRLLDFQPSFFKARSNQDFSLRTPDLRDHGSPSLWPQWQEGMDFLLKGMNKTNAVGTFL